MRTSFLVILFGVLTFPSLISAEERSFLMGTSQFFADGAGFNFKYENLDDKDLLALHLDDFYGIPWGSFQTGGALPLVWVTQWEQARSQAAATGKPIYLAVSPLGSRKTLTKRANADGTTTSDWAPANSSGCYLFSSDANAATYRAAYIAYCKYVIRLIRPRYFSPAIEMNVQFTLCPDQKAAFMQWYAPIHTALKDEFPEVVIFPTFQMEHLYGIAEAGAWCGGVRTDASLAACFDQKLAEALTLPGDRLGLSTYPINWKYPPTLPDHYTLGFPYEATFQRVQAATSRRVWIAETGWYAARVFATYQHTSPPSACGSEFVDATVIGNDTQHTTHMTSLLAQAQKHSFEGVVWWLNRDYLDHTIAGTCPCPGSNDTCSLTENFYQAGGAATELGIRIFGNMGLRYLDGTPRPAYSVWASYLNQTFAIPSTLASVRAYPNPFRPSRGHRTINFSNVPADTHVQIYTLAGERVLDKRSDSLGFVSWDGKTESGRAVASGVYMALFEKSGEKHRLKIAVQR